MLVIATVGERRYAFAQQDASISDSWAVPAAKDPDLRIRALAYAILAPNNFNLQPWICELVGDDRLIVRVNLGRRSPQCDPEDRQTTVSFGTFLELLRIAAAETGYSLAVEAFPEGEPDPQVDGRAMAVVTFSAGGAVRDPLFAQITRRRSNKRPFDTGLPLSPADREALLSAATAPSMANVIIDTDHVAQIKAVARDAALLEMNLPRLLAETASFTRLGRTEVVQAPFGIALTAPAVEAALKDSKLTRAALLDPNSDFLQNARRSYARLIETAAGVTYIVTPTNSRRDQMKAGSEWVRLNLKATELGLAMGPHSHSLHTYPEMEPLYARMRALLLGTDAGTSRVQMFGRVGHGETVPPTPRASVRTFLT